MGTKHRTREDVLSDLSAVSTQLSFHVGESERLYRARDELFVEAREKLDPPLTQRAIADAAGMKIPAFVAAYRKIVRKRDDR